MLFTNKDLKVEVREMKFGQVTGVAIGEYGRGRREVFLPTPNGIEGEIANLRTDLTIGQSKSGRPRINRAPANDSEIYLLLSTKRGYTRRGDGCIRVPEGQEVQIIARGNGADGDAGRIGQWTALVLKAKDGDIFRVTWAGYGYGFDATFYVVLGGKVYVADQPEIEDLYESLGMEVPFTLSFKDSKLSVISGEWTFI